MSQQLTTENRPRSAKIALVGAHGTGKTTLARILESQSSLIGANIDVVITPEIPRIICTAAGDSEYFRRGKNNLLKQLLLIAAQPIYETYHSRKAELLICDRSLLDHWAYTKTLFEHDLPEDIELILTALIQRHLASYNLLIYVPIEFAVHDDGTREGDAEFQAEIDSFIHSCLKNWQIPFVEIRGTIEARTSHLVDEIRSLI